MKENGTTIHWHGFRQLNNNEADGVNGITQCPIAPEHTYTYKFRATEYGHTWYHSHYSLQYPDGVVGPIIIHGPQSANYDVDVGTVLVSDWSHETAFIDFFRELTNGPPPMQSNLLQGKGRFPCVQGDPRCVGPPANYYELKFEKGKKYLLRLINTSTGSQFKFSIDNHILTVVSADFVPIQPYQTKYLNIGIGQRYSVIVEANPSGDDASVNMDYWIRTIPADGCNSIQFPVKQTGIIRYYNNSTYTLPVSTFWKLSENQTSEPDDCVDEDMENLVPVVPKSIIPGSNANNYSSDTYEVGLTEPTAQNPTPHGNYSRWDISMLPMWLDWGNPTILNLDRNVSSMSQELAIVPEDYQDKWVVLVIVGNLQFPSGHNMNKASIPTRHPIHLHGHDFLLLAQNDTEWDTPTWTAAEAFSNMNYTNPPRRDVALLPKDGYIVIAFKTDNPGTWLIHCHIAWHASSGLAMQIMEDQENIAKTIKNKQAIEDNCAAWATWNTTKGRVEQDDSGV
ncbi:Cupredoxin [Choiromyces venosus 120613-1]|uniref:Cupredoxin n=1 Tax=Choiromyces venosus 120613-1 TaxID=1336337 RepID=A0A3N4JEF9_9PEZI|nr:Cupredoxin [Choiromyces venosus 120613-1]